MDHQTVVNKGVLPVGLAIGHSIVEFMTGVAPSAYSSVGINNHSWSAINVARQLFGGVNLDTWYDNSSPTRMLGANHGRSSEGVFQALPRIGELIKSRRLSFVILDHAGLNDLWVHGRTLEQTKEAFFTALEMLTESVPLVIVANNRMPLPGGVPTTVVPKLRDMNIYINDLVSSYSNTELWDVNAISANAVSKSIDPFLPGDMVHPGVYGAHLEAEALANIWRKYYPPIPGTPDPCNIDNLCPSFSDATRVGTGFVFNQYTAQVMEGGAQLSTNVDYPQGLYRLSQVLTIRPNLNRGRVSFMTKIKVPSWVINRWVQAVIPIDMLGGAPWLGADLQVNGLAGANTMPSAGKESKMPGSHWYKILQTEPFVVVRDEVDLIVNINYDPGPGPYYIIMRQPFFGEVPDPRMFR